MPDIPESDWNRVEEAITGVPVVQKPGLEKWQKALIGMWVFSIIGLISLAFYYNNYVESEQATSTELNDTGCSGPLDNPCEIMVWNKSLSNEEIDGMFKGWKQVDLGTMFGVGNLSRNHTWQVWARPLEENAWHFYTVIYIHDNGTDRYLERFYVDGNVSDRTNVHMILENKDKAVRGGEPT
jgi:hypothetical protein